MYDIDFIASVVNKVIAAAKRSDVKEVTLASLTSDGTRAKKRTAYTATYAMKVDMMQRIKTHAELNVFPENLFTAKAPRQTREELDYIRANYKQVTLPVYMDYLSTISRIFHDTNYAIEYNNSNNDFQSYVENSLPIYGSLENFVKFVLPHLKSTDANGIIAVEPYSVQYTTTDAGEKVIDDTQLFSPYPVYYSCEQIVAEDYGNYYLVETNERSFVQYHNREQQVGKIYKWFDAENIYTITQVGKYTDYEFVVELFVAHNSGYVPCVKLMGVPMVQDNSVVYVSPFNYAVDLLDLVAVNSSYLQIVINNCVFPFRVMYGDICEFEYTDRNNERAYCNSGFVYDSVRQTQITCPACSGSGLKSRVSPLGVMLLKPRTTTSEGDSGLSQAPMQYIEPTMATPTFLLQKIDSDENKARKILHLHTSSSSVTGGETLATDMMLDLKALYAFLKPISDQIFTIWEFLANAIGVQRYGSAFEKPAYNYPINFDFNTEKDYTLQVGEAVKAGMPSFVLQTILFKYLQSIYYNENTSAAVLNLIYTADRLLPFTNDEVALKQGRGVVEQWEVVLHDSAITFVNNLLDSNPDFLQQDIATQKQQLIDAAKQKANEIAGIQQAQHEAQVLSIVSNSSAIADAAMQADENGDSSMEDSNSDNSDNSNGDNSNGMSAAEQQAKLELQASIGGVQGILELQRSVSAGTTDKDAAIAILEVVYGFTNEEAVRIIGTPKSVAQIQNETGNNVNVSV